MPAKPPKRAPDAFRRTPLLFAALALCAWSALCSWFVYSRGWLLYYGDAEAHLNIARRILDSRTPGYDQLGSPWLPLPHALMLPFTRSDYLWQTGLAGTIPSALSFVIAGCFLFAAARRLFGSDAAGVAAAGLLAANPNMMYLQSTAMTEAPLAAALAALLYFTVRFRQTQGWGSVAGAGLAAAAACLTRYEAWFLLPFVAVYFFFAAGRARLATAIVFSVIAGAAPLYWLGHNWWIIGDPLEFYRGRYSAQAIQGGRSYPGKGNWHEAWTYYSAAVQLCAGPVVVLMGVAGVIAGLVKRAWWALLLLALPAAFYLLSIHSAGTPIYVPQFWPHSYYNTRYGLAALPLLALAGAALVSAAPEGIRRVAAALAIAAGAGWWLAHPSPESWTTWAESRANSEGRRAALNETAAYLAPRYVHGSGIATSGGDDFAGIYRAMGAPLRDTYNVNNRVFWDAALSRPELFLHGQWAVAERGDRLAAALTRAAGYGVRYKLELTVEKKDVPVIEIYRRVGGPRGPA